jgi:hypothetical protein
MLNDLSSAAPAGAAGLGAILALAAVTACSALVGADSVSYAAPDAATGTDAAADAADGDAAQADPSTYNDFTNVDFWKWFDLATLPPLFTTESLVWSGGVFDGRYVYLAPNAGPLNAHPVARYDTTGTFDSGAAWTMFDINNVDGPQSFAGATFDGRYVYYPPALEPAASPSTAVRYDTQAEFTSLRAYDMFPHPPLTNFHGGAFDGKFFYLAPYDVTSVARYDLSGPFAASASWSSFDVQSLGSAIGNRYEGAVVAGDFVYFVPNLGSTLMRCRARSLSFGAKATWTAFDLQSVGAPGAFDGAVFDGRYLYLVPVDDPSSATVARYDTTMDLAPAAWAIFPLHDAPGAACCYRTGAFDGRYVYFIPSQRDPTTSRLLRYDTRAPFTASASWATFDLTGQLASSLYAFGGAVFDGRYLYLVPNGVRVAARFDAKSPPAMPSVFPAGSGSFY